MKKLKLFVGLIVLCYFSMSFVEISEGKYTNTKSGNELIVQGTSSIHDWEMKAEDYRCDVEIDIIENNMKINSVTMEVKSSSISEGNRIMDDKAHNALKADKHPEIIFKLTSPLTLPLNSNSFSGAAKGKLTIAGFTKSVTVGFNGKVIDSNQIQITGTQKLKMSDFNISPPTAMMGALKTSDDISISFKIKYVKN